MYPLAKLVSYDCKLLNPFEINGLSNLVLFYLHCHTNLLSRFFYSIDIYFAKRIFILSVLKLFKNKIGFTSQKTTDIFT
jgi:hypothetical protein